MKRWFKLVASIGILVAILGGAVIAAGLGTGHRGWRLVSFCAEITAAEGALFGAIWCSAWLFATRNEP